jgi:hypothetical protein
MPKGLDIDKIVAEALRRLGQSGVADDAARVGGNLVDDISKALSQATGKAPKPAKPKMPKNPPKSGRGKNPPAAGAVAPAPKGPKPKSPKSGSADAAEREARRQANRDNWAKEREAYNKMKAIEREERKAGNRAKWAATLEEKYGGNIVEARKATSKGRNRNKKDKK